MWQPPRYYEDDLPLISAYVPGAVSVHSLGPKEKENGKPLQDKPIAFCQKKLGKIRAASRDDIETAEGSHISEDKACRKVSLEIWAPENSVPATAQRQVLVGIIESFVSSRADCHLVSDLSRREQEADAFYSRKIAASLWASWRVYLLVNRHKPIIVVTIKSQRIETSISSLVLPIVDSTPIPGVVRVQPVIQSLGHDHSQFEVTSELEFRAPSVTPKVLLPYHPPPTHTHTLIFP